MSRIRVALFRENAEAERARQSLARAGIAAEVHDELGLAKLWFVPKRGAGVRLEVPVREVERAAELLKEWARGTGSLRDAVRCPECQSLRVAYPQVTEKSLLTNLLMGIAAGLRLVEREYYCEDCHCMWAKPRSKPERPRAHMAPNYFLEAVSPGAVPEPQFTRPEPQSRAHRI